ncbi:uncharacterized protein LOC129302038 [Prosopis cineraria]|uniref:uncharacterized protein LOC129302038 n=1 Tax=Prosopis cineraria TaxID=364024 RepID=UPI00240FD182|nr:uncharacterized protein LOC129302038 [Prosopis cineraria]
MNEEFRSKIRKTIKEEFRSKDPKTVSAEEAEHEELLRLSLSTGSSCQLLPQNPPLPPPESPPHHSLLQLMPPSSSSPPLLHPSWSPPQRPHHDASSQPPESQQPQAPPANPTRTPEGQAGPFGARRWRKKHKETSIEPPYPWAKPSRAKVLSMEELLSRNITLISGDVHCKVCEEQYQIDFDLQTKFAEVASFIDETKDNMHDRAPKKWCNPENLDCKLCGSSKCVEPLVNTKKRSTNWLFLFLGQMIGHCNIAYLRYFCKHVNRHRTAAKDRLLYSTYMDLRDQLDPNADVL